MATELQIVWLLGSMAEKEIKHVFVNITFQSKSANWLELRLSELSDMIDVLSNKTFYLTIEFIHYQVAK